MALTPASRAAIREWTGSQPDDATLDVSWARHGSVYRVALEVLRGRLADSLEVTDLDVDGFVSEGGLSSEAIKALRARVTQLEALVDGEADADAAAAGGGGGISTARLRRRFPR